MARKSGTVRSCYAWSGGAYGARDLFLCAPAVLGRDGVERLVELRLDPARRVIVDRAVDRLAEFSAAP
jgi:malate/lactate dehydrogenase